MADLYSEMMYPGRGFPKPEHESQSPGSSPSPWEKLSKGGMLGKRVVIPYFTTVGPGSHSAAQAQPAPVDVLKVQGDDGAAQQLCVTLSQTKLTPGVLSANVITGDVQALTGEQDNIDASGAPQVGGRVNVAAANTRFANPLAIVQWGVGGVSNRAEVDYHNGLCINVVASWLRVSAAIEGPNVITSSFPYVLGAFVGPGFPRANNAQRTILVESLDTDDESVVYTVPRYAKSVTLAGGNADNDVYLAYIRFWRSNAGPADYAGVPVASYVMSGNDPQPIVIPAGAYFFTIISGLPLGSQAINSHNAIFDLSI